MAEKNLYTVIVADDEDELREAVCTMIPWEALGFHLVGSASNGLDALELVEQLEPDLLLTDIRMPFITGIELARQVREIRPAMHIAFLSGFDGVGGIIAVFQHQRDQEGRAVLLHDAAAAQAGILVVDALMDGF